MQEGISYLAGAELPCLILNVVRGGPGLGTIQPAQSDYFQATKGGGHGDYRLITLAPSSVQEMYDFVPLGFELAFRYRTPVMVLSDGAIGQMMEKVEVGEQATRLTEEEIRETYPWATLGRYKGRERNIITSLDLDPARHERHNIALQEKYGKIVENEPRWETIDTDDADYLFVAYGTSARICLKSMQLLREKGIKVGLLRPITLFPFPSKALKELAGNVKGILSVEMSAGQMVEDIQLFVEGRVPVEHYGRMGGIIPSPIEVAEQLQKKFLKG
jgi:2-oxoglutarate ferredoxin oxidoreductase subunit alpha